MWTWDPSPWQVSVDKSTCNSLWFERVWQRVKIEGFGVSFAFNGFYVGLDGVFEVTFNQIDTIFLSNYLLIVYV